VLRYAVAAAVIALTGCGGSNDAKALVVQECKDSVQAHLTYNASFPFFDPTPEKDASGMWHVSGSVTAQNGFGAKRTVHWACTVDNNGNVQTSVG
jgi:hypothetical protein